MDRDFDMELGVRLTLHELLFSVQIAQQAATMPDGARELASFRDAIVERMVNRVRTHEAMTDEQRVEWAVNAKTVTERLFARAEDRRAEIRKLLDNS